MQLLGPQKQAIRRFGTAGFILLLWRRQLGKTTTIAHLALKRMMKKRGHLFTFASASLLVGREVIYREAAILESALEELGKQAAAANCMLQVMDRDSGKIIGGGESTLTQPSPLPGRGKSSG